MVTVWSKHFMCVLSAVVLAGCKSGGSVSDISTNAPSFTAVDVLGQYQAELVSSADPSQITLLALNLKQNGNTISASKANVILIGGTVSNNQITISTLGGACDSGSLGGDSFAGSFTSPTNATFTLSESQGGTASGQVTFSSDGTQIVSGSYSTPNQCGYAPDTGTITGTQIQPFSGSYAGVLENSSGGQDAYIVTVTQTNSYLIISGTDNGAQITLTGSVVGGIFNVSGTIDGQQEQVFGLYDNTNNAFLVFNSLGLYVGTLSAGTNPQAVSKVPGMFAHTGWSH